MKIEDLPAYILAAMFMLIVFGLTIKLGIWAFSWIF